MFAVRFSPDNRRQPVSQAPVTFLPPDQRAVRAPQLFWQANRPRSSRSGCSCSWVVIRGSPGGDDYHQAWISREDPNTMVLASDQGCIITRNAKSPDPRDVTWSSWLNQPTAQVYHVSVDYRFPYWVTGAQQDSGGGRERLH